MALEGESLGMGGLKAGNRNEGKGNGAGLAWESKSHCFADKFGIPYTHSFGTGTHTWRFRPGLKF